MVNLPHPTEILVSKFEKGPNISFDPDHGRNMLNIDLLIARRFDLVTLNDSDLFAGIVNFGELFNERLRFETVVDLRFIALIDDVQFS
jgi:hypothetical protein